MCYIYTVKMNDYMGQWMLNTHLCYFCQIHLKRDMEKHAICECYFYKFYDDVTIMEINTNPGLQ